MSVKVVANYANGRLKLRPQLMARMAKPDFAKLKPTSIALSTVGSVDASDEGSAVIEAMLHYWYIGKSAKASEIMHRYLRFDHPAVKSIFLTELFGLMSRSIYWDQIRKLNHWYDDALDGKVELWSVDRVRGEVFAGSEK